MLEVGIGEGVVPGRGIWGCFPRMEDLELFVLGGGNWGGRFTTYRPLNSASQGTF